MTAKEIGFVDCNTMNGPGTALARWKHAQLEIDV